MAVDTLNIIVHGLATVVSIFMLVKCLTSNSVRSHSKFKLFLRAAILGIVGWGLPLIGDFNGESLKNILHSVGLPLIAGWSYSLWRIGRSDRVREA